MSIIDEALSANATIANNYDPGHGGPPAPKIAIVTCADPRLTSIEKMLGLAAADVDMIRNFGTVIDDDAVSRAGCGCCSRNTAWLPSIPSPPPSTTSGPHGAGSAPART
jgi:hypothetical protein